MGGMIEVRAYGPADARAFLDLYRTCLAHYDYDPAPDTVEAELLRELAAHDGTRAHIAWRDAEPVGFAFSLRVPAGPGFALYLKELFVTQAARGTGAGRGLMRAVAERATSMGASRLQWETGDASARPFYARLGAKDDGKTHYTIHAADLPAFALP